MQFTYANMLAFTIFEKLGVGYFETTHNTAVS